MSRTSTNHIGPGSSNGSESTSSWSQNERSSPAAWNESQLAPGRAISVHSTSSRPRRRSRSRAKRFGPFRETEPGVTRPEMRKNRPVEKSAAGITPIITTRSLAHPSWTSWMSWYGHALSSVL